MMTLVNMDSPGLVVLPHSPGRSWAGVVLLPRLREKASAYFSVEEVDAAVDTSRISVILREAGRIGTAMLA